MMRAAPKVEHICATINLSTHQSLARPRLVSIVYPESDKYLCQELFVRKLVLVSEHLFTRNAEYFSSTFIFPCKH